MGLLEKALNYKNKINSSGQKTIMDRIKGPADGELSAESGKKEKKKKRSSEIRGDIEEVVFLGDGDLVSLKDDEISDSAKGVRGEKISGPDSTIETDKKEMLGIDGSSEGVYDAGKAAAIPETAVVDGIDYMILYEISREIVQAENKEEFNDAILFSVMGQLGVSSSSVMVPLLDEKNQWGIVESRGVTIDKQELLFNPDEGILNELLNRKEIVDLDEFKNHQDLQDEFYKYISIDARFLVPLIYEGGVIAVLILGEKLSAEQYTDEDKKFINAIADFSALVYHSILDYEKNSRDMYELEKDVKHIIDADYIYNRIKPAATVEGVRTILRDELQRNGIIKFALFLKNNASGIFETAVCSKDDELLLENTGFTILPESLLIKRILSSDGPAIYEDLHHSKDIVEIFTERQIDQMRMFNVFSYKTGEDLNGFLIVFQINEEIITGDFLLPKMVRVVESIFPHFILVRDAEYRKGRYVDNIEHVYRKIEKEIKNAHNLSIPLTLIVFTIKNYKRYYSLFGFEKTEMLLDDIEDLISGRLADNDFSIRYDRHKIIIVLPGKDKKYAVPLCNALANEIVTRHSTQDVQLLATYLTAEFPYDGIDVNSLINSID